MHVKKFVQIVVNIVEKVEQIFAGETGEEKKKRAVAIINAFVDIPHVPEFLEAQIYEVAIEIVVFMFNKLVWKKDLV
jgi:hypothetical protein